MGRPSKYDPAYCERVIELGKRGMSVVEMACEIGVARSTLEEAWPKAHPEFSEAFARARDESQAWWERTGRDGMRSKSIDAQIWSRSMAARFPKDWRESKLLGSDPDNPLPAGFVIRDVDGPADA
jgi:lambda repressor-like predicted transcriptional regulator